VVSLKGPPVRRFSMSSVRSLERIGLLSQADLDPLLLPPSKVRLGYPLWDIYPASEVRVEELIFAASQRAGP